MISHDLDDKHSSFSSRGRLPDLVADDRDLVQGRIGSEAVVSSGHIVADRGWDLK